MLACELGLNLTGSCLCGLLNLYIFGVKINLVPNVGSEKCSEKRSDQNDGPDRDILILLSTKNILLCFGSNQN
jgi:hypothetical protein